MRTIDSLHRSGVGIGPERTIRDAAGLMEQAGVGSLAVVDGDRLIGLVTDRDLVRRVLARGLAPDARIDSVMTTPVVTIAASADLDQAYVLFGIHGLRRLAGLPSADLAAADLKSSGLLDFAAMRGFPELRG